MSAMNISLPGQLKSFVDEQVSQRGYGTSSEYVRELIRKDQDRLQMRALLMTGAASKPTGPVSEAYFEGLRQRVRAACQACRSAHELNLPGLRTWPLNKYPHLVFYVEHTDHIDVWRVLHGQRDILAWMQVPEDTL